jgi:PE family
VWVEDAIGRVATGFAHWGGAGLGIKLRVDEHNVAGAARLVREEAARFRAKLNAREGGLRVRPVGGDPVSEEAAKVLNWKFTEGPDSYFMRCQEYADMLDRLAEQLDQAAATYRETEERNRAAFDSAARELM